MNDIKLDWKLKLEEALFALALKQGLDISRDNFNLIVETPPKPEMGDLAFPLFPFAKMFKKNPVEIARDVKLYINENDPHSESSINSTGPYLNIKIDLSDITGKIINDILNAGNKYGYTDNYTNKKVMVEFSCPNTNKPLHLGHLRNDSIGMSVSRIMAANGADLRKVNLINDRGVHICKSMLAYKIFGDNQTPDSAGVKSDHFVGDYYVKFNTWSKEFPEAETEARAMLKEWDDGKSDITELWKMMNDWTISGIKETYLKTGVSFDKYYFESKTYMEGRAEVLKGFDAGVFYKEADGSIWADLSEIKLDKKVLLRSDGTSLYLTQDIGTAIARHRDWGFEKLIYVVGSEQQYHFQVLFYILKKLGFEWANDLHHLSYGMVNLPDGKMKSREGTVVDADDLVDELTSIAKKEIIAKERASLVGDLQKTSESVALAALNYFLLQISPGKDMIFDPAESISFSGNTGPYLQYMGARISSMLRKFEDRKDEFTKAKFNPEILVLDQERELIKLLLSFPEIVSDAGKGMNPSVITTYLYELSKVFSRYYHDTSILKDPDKDTVVSRIYLVKAVLQVLKNAFYLVGIPFLERM
ncbi:MAG: arginine--tRNA ligase [Spirochaetia bacterium]|jgi:arginyl-tRNA synthetase|nr:arginine--tRNA ligase [Spirochaetia bacterium]